jgi:hypothetical protein
VMSTTGNPSLAIFQAIIFTGCSGAGGVAQSYDARDDRWLSDGVMIGRSSTMRTNGADVRGGVCMNDESTIIAFVK